MGMMCQLESLRRAGAVLLVVAVAVLPMLHATPTHASARARPGAAGDRVQPMGLKELCNVRAPVFAPRWRRVAVCVVLALWTLVEALGGNLFWVGLTAAATAWCFYEFFLIFDADTDAGR